MSVSNFPEVTTALSNLTASPAPVTSPKATLTGTTRTPTIKTLIMAVYSPNPTALSITTPKLNFAVEKTETTEPELIFLKILVTLCFRILLNTVRRWKTKLINEPGFYSIMRMMSLLIIVWCIVSIVILLFEIWRMVWGFMSVFITRFWWEIRHQLWKPKKNR